MMASAQEAVLHLPDELVALSHGFSLDIGGSIAKLLYRSKEDYEGGKRKDSSSEGGVRMVNFPRDDVDAVIRTLKESCDLSRDAHGVAHVYSTGFGGSFYARKFEEELGVKMHNGSEFDFFARAFTELVRHVPRDRAFLPLNQDAITSAENLIARFKKMDGPVGGKENEDIPEPYTLPENLEDIFPCLLVLAGSGNPILRMERSGTYKIQTDFPVLGGRFMLAFSKMCCGVESFDEMEALIAGSDQGASCDAFPQDLVPAKSTAQRDAAAGEEKDIYQRLASIESKAETTAPYRVFPFGKGTMPSFKEASKGDILYSMQRSVAETLAQATFLMTFREGVRNVFFSGNFVSTPRVQYFITEAIHGMNMKLKPDERRNFRFVRNGGHLGAIGGFFFSQPEDTPKH